MAGGPYDEAVDAVMVVISLVVILNFIHQLLLYINLHNMEHGSERWLTSFPGWFNSKPEFILRLSLIHI